MICASPFFSERTFHLPRQQRDRGSGFIGTLRPRWRSWSARWTMCGHGGSGRCSDGISGSERLRPHCCWWRESHPSSPASQCAGFARRAGTRYRRILRRRTCRGCHLDHHCRPTEALARLADRPPAEGLESRVIVARLCAASQTSGPVRAGPRHGQEPNWTGAISVDSGSYCAAGGSWKGRPLKSQQCGPKRAP